MRAEWSRRLGRYTAEFAVIFLGVSLSFCAEDLREDRRDRQAEHASLARLLSDLAESDFDNELSRSRQSLSGIARIVAARDSAAPQADSLSRWLSDAVACTPIVVNRSEYESLRSSGGLNLLRDADLRRLLTAHYERYDAVLEFSRRDCDFSFMLPIAEHVRVQQGFPFPRYVVVGNTRAIMDNDDFMMRLAHTGQLKNLLRIRYDIMAAQRDTLMQRVESQLER